MAEEKLETLQIVDGTSNITDLSVLQVTPQSITLRYHLLPDTTPGSFGNFVAIWQNTNNIPYNQDPEKKQNVTGSTQSGTTTFVVDLTRNNYIVGYSVGPELTAPSQKVGNVCSTVYIPMLNTGSIVEGAAEPYAAFQTKLSVGVITPNSITFKYEVPTNCRPASNKAWVALFRGDASYTTAPEKAMAITSDEDSGWVAWNDLKILFDRKYTIAWFMSGYAADGTRIQTRMAATVSFTG